MNNLISNHLCIVLYFYIHLLQYRNLFKSHKYRQKRLRLTFSFLISFLPLFYGLETFFFKIFPESIGDYNCKKYFSDIIVKTFLNMLIRAYSLITNKIMRSFNMVLLGGINNFSRYIIKIY